MKKFWKLFDFKFGMNKKRWCPDPHPLTNSKSRALWKWKLSQKLFKFVPRSPLSQKFSKFRALYKWKKSEKFFGLKFGMTKKSWYPDPNPPWKIQSPELSVNEKNLKNFIPQIWHDQKKFVTWPLPSQKFSKSRVLCKGKNSEKFFSLKFGKVGAQSLTPPLPQTNWESRALGKAKYAENILTSNLV